MHDQVRSELVNWYYENLELINKVKVADLGANNINGSVSETISHVVGFDIVINDNVDVVIVPGIIPDEHKNIYGAVTTVSSFQFCPDSQLYKQQIIDLLCDNGLLFLTMCTTKCKSTHNTSINDYDYGDSVRYSKDELRNIFASEFEIIDLYETEYNHHPDLILKARKK